MARSESDKESIPSVIPTSLQCYVECVLKSSEINNRGKLMKNEWARYISFGAFPRDSPVHPIRLSKSGFYYTGQDDETICFSCGFRNKNWKAGESPSEVHTRLSPNCHFANGTGDGNIPILGVNVYLNGSCRDTNQISNPNITQSPARGSSNRNEEQFKPLCTKKNDEVTNTCNAHGQYSSTDAKDTPEEATNNISRFAEGQRTSSRTLDKIHHGASRDPEFSNITNRTPTSKTEDFELETYKPEPVKQTSVNQTIDNLGIYVEKPKHPHYSILTSRLESFKGWPSLSAQKQSDLADAGLYYVGVGDCVRCFCCGGGLRSWEEGDDPWEEHARWYPNCAFLKQYKGEDFVLRQLAGINLRSEETLEIEPHDSGASEMRSRDETGNMAIKSTFGEAASANSMDSPAAQSIISMGYSLGMIRQAMERLESREGLSKILVNDLLEVIFETEEAQSSKQAKRFNSTNDMIQNLNNINGKEYRANASNEQKNNHCSPHDNNHSEDEEENDDSSKCNLTSKELESVLEQNQELKDQMTCKICMNIEACIVFLPCCHMMACPQCAPAFRKCPMCRQLIKGTVRAYIS